MNPSGLESAIGIAFLDKSLLMRALTHRSYLNENARPEAQDNERLEFLGDAVLDFLTGEYLYNRFPEMQEGELTNLRSALVKRDSLAHFARSLSLGDYLLLSRGEQAGGGHRRVSLLAGAFEALIGALYLDLGLDAVRAFWYRQVEAYLFQMLQKRIERDAKSRLQELSQGTLQARPAYVLVSETGPAHAREFVVEVRIGERTMGTGRGPTKQHAEQEAALRALDALEREAADQSAAGAS